MPLEDASSSRRMEEDGFYSDGNALPRPRPDSNDSTHSPPSIHTHRSDQGTDHQFRPIYVGLHKYLCGQESLETYGANLIKVFPSEYEDGIRQLMTDLRPFTVDELTLDVTTPIWDSFVRRFNAVCAKRQARESESKLL
jgi:hypothetical protein